MGDFFWIFSKIGAIFLVLVWFVGGSGWLVFNFGWGSSDGFLFLAVGSSVLGFLGTFLNIGAILVSLGFSFFTGWVGWLASVGVLCW